MENTRRFTRSACLFPKTHVHTMKTRSNIQVEGSDFGRNQFIHKTLGWGVKHTKLCASYVASVCNKAAEHNFPVSLDFSWAKLQFLRRCELAQLSLGVLVCVGFIAAKIGAPSVQSSITTCRLCWIFLSRRKAHILSSQKLSS